jgi:hypothetical protein
MPWLLIHRQLICAALPLLFSDYFIAIVQTFPIEGKMRNNKSKPSSLSSTSTAPIIIGYASNPNSGKVERAIHDGASVIIWSFVHFEIDMSSSLGGRIRTSLDLDAIRKIRSEITRHNNKDKVIHLAAFGGWNGPHPPSGLTGTQWVDVFDEFNTIAGANDDDDDDDDDDERFQLFDGIDWDYEGHDDIHSSTSQFTIETLNIIVDFSIEAKSRGYIVSMAPAESYLDSTINTGSIDGEFSLALNLPPRAWTTSSLATNEDRIIINNANFKHAGRQCYAYILAKAGIDTFDWISIQLYEAYSPFAHDIHRKHIDQTLALMKRIRSFVTGYTVTGLPLSVVDLVDSSSSSSSTSLLSHQDTTLTQFVVQIPLEKLVIGIANYWVDGMKFCNVNPKAIRLAYEQTMVEYDGRGFLGVMFWTVEEEGGGGADEDDTEKRLTFLLNKEFKNIGRLTSEL